MISRFTFVGLLAISLLLLPSTRSNAQEPAASQSTPEALARQSFEAIKRRDIPAFVSLFHPDAIKRFKGFATELFKVDDRAGKLAAMRKMFAPFDTAQKIAAASGSDLLIAIHKNFFESNPGLDEILKEAKVEILGAIVEPPDKVHVITRTFLPRPSPVTCQKHDGRWSLLLNDETLRMISQFEQIEHFRKKNIPVEELAKKTTIDQISVVGYVNDDDDTAQVLCRIRGTIDDFSFPILGCYPVRKGEPAWDHLNDKDKAKLADALRAKWTR
jgi:hypothetical protein